jgi:hypothetical protein
MFLRDLVLKAAAALPESFTLSDLVVQSWKLDPEHVGLTGYPYPDSRKVATVLYGAKGLIERGQLRKLINDRLSLDVSTRLELETDAEPPAADDVGLTDTERKMWLRGDRNTATLVVMKRLGVDAKHALKLIEEIMAEVAA